MNITGKHTVFVNEGATQDGRTYKNYSIGISEKQEDGKWLTYYMYCNFRKGVELANKTQIEIKNAWLKPYPTKDGKAGIKAFISEFDIVEKPVDSVDNYATAYTDDLPF